MPKPNDWPAEVKNIRRIGEAEARQLGHDEIPPQRAEQAQAEWKEQLKRDKQHPAWGLRDRGDEED